MNGTRNSIPRGRRCCRPRSGSRPTSLEPHRRVRVLPRRVELGARPGGVGVLLLGLEALRRGRRASGRCADCCSRSARKTASASAGLAVAQERRAERLAHRVVPGRAARRRRGASSASTAFLQLAIAAARSPFASAMRASSTFAATARTAAAPVLRPGHARRRESRRARARRPRAASPRSSDVALRRGGHRARVEPAPRAAAAASAPGPASCGCRPTCWKRSATKAGCSRKPSSIGSMRRRPAATSSKSTSPAVFAAAWRPAMRRGVRLEVDVVVVVHHRVHALRARSRGCTRDPLRPRRRWTSRRRRSRPCARRRARACGRGARPRAPASRGAWPTAARARDSSRPRRRGCRSGWRPDGSGRASGPTRARRRSRSCSRPARRRASRASRACRFMRLSA